MKIKMDSWQEGGFESQEQYEQIQEDNLQMLRYEEEEQIFIEDGEKLLNAFTVEEILKDTKSVTSEFQDNVKISYKTLKYVTEQNDGITFANGLTLKYTKPKTLTEKDYLDKIAKKEEELAKAKDDLENFRKHGCKDTASKPQLRFGTTNNKFKEAVLERKQQLLKNLPAINDIRQYVKQIDN